MKGVPVTPVVGPRYLTAANALTLCAICFGLRGFWMGVVNHNLFQTVVMMGLSGMMCCVDGIVAKTSRQATTFGDEILQPAAGLVLAVTGIATMTVNGYWPWYIWVTLTIVFVAVLQGIDLLARFWPMLVNRLWYKSNPGRRRRYQLALRVGRFIKVAKRHQFYLHPLGSILVTIVAATHMAVVIAGPEYTAPIIAGGVAVTGGLARFRFERVMFWLAGPK